MKKVFSIGDKSFNLSDIRYCFTVNKEYIFRPVYRYNGNSYSYAGTESFMPFCDGVDTESIKLKIKMPDGSECEENGVNVRADVNIYYGAEVRNVECLVVITDREYCFYGEGIDVTDVQAELNRYRQLKNKSKSFIGAVAAVAIVVALVGVLCGNRFLSEKASVIMDETTAFTETTQRTNDFYFETTSAEPEPSTDDSLYFVINDLTEAATEETVTEKVTSTEFVETETTVTEAAATEASTTEIITTEVATTEIVTAQVAVTEAVTAETTVAKETAPLSEKKSDTVWIPRSGSKYHSSSTCSNMKNPSKVTVSEAVEKGYTPCSKCY